MGFLVPDVSQIKNIYYSPANTCGVTACVLFACVFPHLPPSKAFVAQRYNTLSSSLLMEYEFDVAHKFFFFRFHSTDLT